MTLAARSHLILPEALGGKQCNDHRPHFSGGYTGAPQNTSRVHLALSLTNSQTSPTAVVRPIPAAPLFPHLGAPSPLGCVSPTHSRLCQPPFSPHPHSPAHFWPPASKPVPPNVHVQQPGPRWNRTGSAINSRHPTLDLLNQRLRGGASIAGLNKLSR